MSPFYDENSGPEPRNTYYNIVNGLRPMRAAYWMLIAFVIVPLLCGLLYEAAAMLWRGME